MWLYFKIQYKLKEEKKKRAYVEYANGERKICRIELRMSIGNKYIVTFP